MADLVLTLCAEWRINADWHDENGRRDRASTLRECANEMETAYTMRSFLRKIEEAIAKEELPDPLSAPAPESPQPPFATNARFDPNAELESSMSEPEEADTDDTPLWGFHEVGVGVGTLNIGTLNVAKCSAACPDPDCPSCSMLRDVCKVFAGLAGIRPLNTEGKKQSN